MWYWLRGCGLWHCRLVLSLVLSVSATRFRLGWVCLSALSSREATLVLLEYVPYRIGSRPVRKEAV
jgi:hypothetical protein